jgi:hypothetical protein
MENPDCYRVLMVKTIIAAIMKEENLLQWSNLKKMRTDFLRSSDETDLEATDAS